MLVSIELITWGYHTYFVNSKGRVQQEQVWEDSEERQQCLDDEIEVWNNFLLLLWSMPMFILLMIDDLASAEQFA